MHKNAKKLALAFVSSFMLFAAYPVIAADAQILTSANGIKYVTGGIGDEEASAMRGMAKDFSLNLVFSEGSGGKITGVDVVIYSNQGNVVFRIKGASPFLYVALPEGKYHVVANYDGQKQGVACELDGKTNKKVILNWKNSNNEKLVE